MGRKKSNKTFGKHLDTALRLALSSEKEKPNVDLFYVDKADGLTSRQRARKMREKEEKEMMEQLLNADKLSSKTERDRIDAMRAAASRASKSDPTPKQNNNISIWDEEEVEVDPWLKPEAKPITKIAESVRSRPSTKRSLEIVKVSAATSYNPELEEYKQNFQKVIETVERYDYKVKKSQTIAPAEESKDLPYTDMNAPESEEEGEEEEEEEETKEETMDDETPKKRKRREKLPGERVTRAEKNKEKRRKLHQVKERMRVLQKEKAALLNRVDEFQSELDDKEVDAKNRAEALKEKLKTELTKEPKLVGSNGKRFVREPTVEIAMPDELNGTMRQLIPLGNLALDRLHSLHTRNKTEVLHPSLIGKERKRPKRRDVQIGKPFVEIEYDATTGMRRKRRRMNRFGKVDISDVL